MASTSLPDAVKVSLFKQFPSRISTDGDIIIKANRFRTQLQNKEDALNRLADLIIKAAHKPKKRVKTKPSKGAIQKRLDNKKRQSSKKSARSAKRDFD